MPETHKCKAQWCHHELSVKWDYCSSHRPGGFAATVAPVPAPVVEAVTIPATPEKPMSRAERRYRKRGFLRQTPQTDDNIVTVAPVARPLTIDPPAKAARVTDPMAKPVNNAPAPVDGPSETLRAVIARTERALIADGKSATILRGDARRATMATVAGAQEYWRTIAAAA